MTRGGFPDWLGHRAIAADLPAIPTPFPLGVLFYDHVRCSMAEYKFKIGETVYFHPKLLIDAPGGAYQIIRHLPTAEGEFQYMIRSVNEDRQRVAKQRELSRT
jgi:hypothetical protein